MNKMGSVTMLLACTMMSGCAAYGAAKNYSNFNKLDGGYDVREGPSRIIENKDFPVRLGNQGESYDSIRKQLKLSGDDKKDMKDIFYAAASIIDTDCHNYFSALDRLSQDKATGVSETSLIGSTTTSLMGAFNASHVAIATVAALFGLTTQTIENAANNVLYDLPPYATYALVIKAKQTFITYLPIEKISGGPQLITALNSYYELCTPVKIRGFVTEAVRSKSASVDKIDGQGLGFYIPIVNFGGGADSFVKEQPVDGGAKPAPDAKPTAQQQQQIQAEPQAH
ncbi:hypothetical protein [Nitrospirillum amazonense]|uniref:Lipoprotein n=1 Tax=Nitrospirillum amazonense TaxID=28077 RepID=A0A560KAA9_9PROT|nr:hypothetical protein [Nitrospirillum amazonense]MDG3441373.1 hypothetical protein [Nitrospirillum amazonense]TWB80136.1 hypothetical protein FBZ87_102560 [Nitrospirillum amazonense]